MPTSPIALLTFLAAKEPFWKINPPKIVRTQWMHSGISALHRWHWQKHKDGDGSRMATRIHQKTPKSPVAITSWLKTRVGHHLNFNNSDSSSSFWFRFLMILDSDSFRGRVKKVYMNELAHSCCYEHWALVSLILVKWSHSFERRHTLSMVPHNFWTIPGELEYWFRVPIDAQTLLMTQPDSNASKLNIRLFVWDGRNVHGGWCWR